MKVKAIEIIDKVDELKPNDYDIALKLKALTNIENKIIEEIINIHEVEKMEEVTIEEDSELIAENEYSDIYFYYLEAYIHQLNEEYDRYNNAMIMFNQELGDYAKWYNRNYMPTQKGDFKL